MQKIIIPLLLFAAISTMSFTKAPTTCNAPLSVKTGNTLRVTNPSPGTLNMNWAFSQSSLTYTIVIELVINRQVVRSVKTSQTSYLTSGLASGTYRCSVSNGSENIIIDIVLN